MDIADGTTLDRKIERLLAHHNALRKGLGLPLIDPSEVTGPVDVAPRYCPIWIRSGRCSTRSAARASASCSKARRARCSTSTMAPIRRHLLEYGGCAGGDRLGIGPGAIGYVLGICKAYTTRVGEGPFPTEQKNEIGRMLGERGKEFGVVTGRPRRCGWFDAVLVRQTVRTSGINGLALTKLDILDGFDEIKVCVGYRLNGREIDYLPASEHAQAAVEPIYETIAGWGRKPRGARSWAELPAQAIKYVRRIEELIGCSAVLLSTSPEREDTILMQNPFET